MSNQFWWQLIKKYPERFIIAVLVLIIILQRSCHHTYPVKPLPTITPVIKTYYPKSDIKVKKVVEIRYKNRVIKTTDTIIVIKQKHDTVYLNPVQAITNYVGMTAYNDTLMNTKQAFILIQDTLQYNLIKSRTPTIRFKPIFKPVAPRRSLYVGLGVGGGVSSFRFAGKLLYKDRKDRVFGLGYYPLDNTFEVSIYWKIHFKK